MKKGTRYAVALSLASAVAIVAACGSNSTSEKPKVPGEAAKPAGPAPALTNAPRLPNVKTDGGGAKTDGNGAPLPDGAGAKGSALAPLGTLPNGALPLPPTNLTQPMPPSEIPTSPSIANKKISVELNITFPGGGFTDQKLNLEIDQKPGQQTLDIPVPAVFQIFTVAHPNLSQNEKFVEYSTDYRNALEQVKQQKEIVLDPEKYNVVTVGGGLKTPDKEMDRFIKVRRAELNMKAGYKIDFNKTPSADDLKKYPEVLFENLPLNRLQETGWNWSGIAYNFGQFANLGLINKSDLRTFIRSKNSSKEWSFGHEFRDTKFLVFSDLWRDDLENDYFAGRRIDLRLNELQNEFQLNGPYEDRLYLNGLIGNGVSTSLVVRHLEFIALSEKAMTGTVQISMTVKNPDGGQNYSSQKPAIFNWSNIKAASNSKDEKLLSFSINPQTGKLEWTSPYAR